MLFKINMMKIKSPLFLFLFTVTFLIDTHAQTGNFPFEIVAAPWLNKIDFLEKEIDANLILNGIEIIPNEGKYANEKCFGKQFKMNKIVFLGFRKIQKILIHKIK